MTIIDVRDPMEVENGSIPSAVNVPLSRLAEVLGETYPDGAFQKVSVRSRARGARAMQVRVVPSLEAVKPYPRSVSGVHSSAVRLS